MFAIPAFDDLSSDDLSEIAHQWFTTRGFPTTDFVTIDQFYHIVLPRNIFFKSLPSNSRILDVGAGDGALAIQKRWPMVERQDVKLYALSLDVGIHFALYENFEVKNFETDPDVFSGQSFDAIVCAHFIEHMSDPARSVEFFARKLRAGGRLYIEWPHPLTKKLPTRMSLLDRGIDVSTFNFFDDQTHVDAWPAEMLTTLFEKSDFAVETGGRIYLPWLGEQMRECAFNEEDNTRLTLGAWAAFGWAQYLVLNRL